MRSFVMFVTAVCVLFPIRIMPDEPRFKCVSCLRVKIHREVLSNLADGYGKVLDSIKKKNFNSPQLVEYSKEYSCNSRTVQSLAQYLLCKGEGRIGIDFLKPSLFDVSQILPKNPSSVRIHLDL